MGSGRERAKAQAKLEKMDTHLDAQDIWTYYLAQDQPIELPDQLVGLFHELQDFLPRYDWDERRIRGLLELVRDFQAGSWGEC